MGRKRDPKIQRMRERALELEKAGYKPAEISQEEEFVEFGADVETVRRWLRAIRGTRPKARAEYRRLKKEGWSRQEIVEELGISEPYSWQLDREIEGPKRVPAKKRLPTFFEDPERHRFAPWATTKSFGWEKNNYLVALVDDNPAAFTTAEHVRYTYEQLAALLEIRRGKAARWTRCQLVQAVANQAARHRSLKVPEHTLLLLGHGRDLSAGCPACAADLARREAIALRDLGRYEEALDSVRSARAFYSETGEAGHDPDKDGVGNCALVEANILSRRGEYDLATRTSREALRRTSTLYHWLLASICLCAVRSGDTLEARRIYDRHLVDFFCKPSLNRIRLWCLKARLLEVEGHLDAAVQALEDAQLDVEEKVQVPGAIAYIIGELERLSGADPTGKRLALRIDDLGEVENAEVEEGEDSSEEAERPPIWFPPLWLAAKKEVFDRARGLAWSGAVEDALTLIRAEGRSFLPAIA